MKGPLYTTGIHFLSHESGMPAKIFIEAVYRKHNSKEWMYSIFSEANMCKQQYVDEPSLRNRMSMRSSKVYSTPKVMELESKGYRFCGNYTREEAMRVGKEFAKNDKIKSVMLHKAINVYGNYTDDGKYGVWIMWSVVINDNGDSSDMNDTIFIK